CILKKPIYISALSKDKTGELEIAFQYNDGYNEIIHGYANNINTIEAGTHIEGFKKALYKTINEYGHKLKILKDTDKI
ncbi:MAG: DNA topoisomerase IV subunit B, partial [Lachnospiraceae bacterium]|nr:DNA topoisomerase IV subunit B [Lachnospiraceae bacterium]